MHLILLHANEVDAVESQVKRIHQGNNVECKERKGANKETRECLIPKEDAGDSDGEGREREREMKQSS